MDVFRESTIYTNKFIDTYQFQNEGTTDLYKMFLSYKNVVI